MALFSAKLVPGLTGALTKNIIPKIWDSRPSLWEKDGKSEPEINQKYRAFVENPPLFFGFSH